MFGILFWIFLLAVIRIVYQIFKQRQCLDEATLRNLMKSRWKERNEAEYRRAISHLGICDKCAKKLEELNFGKNIEEHLVE